MISNIGLLFFSPIACNGTFYNAPHAFKKWKNNVRMIIARNIIPGHWIFQIGKKMNRKKKIFTEKRGVYAQNSVLFLICPILKNISKFSFGAYADTDILILLQLKWSG